MQAHGVWRGGFQTELDDGRGHVVTVDLPLDEEGNDLGTSALELCAMSLAGCIATIFSLVAKRRRLSYEAMTLHLEVDRPEGAPTITAVSGEVQVTTRALPEEVDTVLRLTLRTCPVGVLLGEAGIPVRVLAVVRPPSPTALGSPA